MKWIQAVVWFSSLVSLTEAAQGGLRQLLSGNTCVCWDDLDQVAAADFFDWKYRTNSAWNIDEVFNSQSRSYYLVQHLNPYEDVPHYNWGYCTVYRHGQSVHSKKRLSREEFRGCRTNMHQEVDRLCADPNLNSSGKYIEGCDTTRVPTPAPHPTPAPTDEPSASPSLSQAPSISPSKAPTITPTVSAAPTTLNGCKGGLAAVEIHLSLSDSASQNQWAIYRIGQAGDNRVHKQLSYKEAPKGMFYTKLEEFCLDDSYNYVFKIFNYWGQFEYDDDDDDDSTDDFFPYAGGMDGGTYEVVVNGVVVRPSADFDDPNKKEDSVCLNLQNVTDTSVCDGVEFEQGYEDVDR
ncbi:expressed unknown protein [Seminavis robusta]|uniref:Uncharacterized protein n=1 Tax=Seminavis robusta TaxID=568900 RepID=A0A9N8F1P2_9STRA|nr:expressed unknown protein [Seminavis robusta]|eukprot:Sro2306_g322740.1 n/a (349) ;mRNA; r:9969-11463